MRFLLVNQTEYRQIARYVTVEHTMAKNFNTKKHNWTPNVKFCDRSATQRWKSNEIALGVMATRKRAKWQSK